jgi:hypothetical protein
VDKLDYLEYFVGSLEIGPKATLKLNRTVATWLIYRTILCFSMSTF